MELNKNYLINIICHTMKNRAKFLAVEKFCKDSSLYFKKYYDKLQLFNDSGEWFEKLDFGMVDIGNVILVQTDIKLNRWCRAIVARNFSPKFYLVDQQRFCSDHEVYALRSCPPRFLQLIVPTYNIEINLCLDDEIRRKIEFIISKHQMGLMSFIFSPQILQNNVYFGKLLIQNRNSKTISLKRLLRSADITRFFDAEDIDQTHDKTMLRLFNPLNFKHLRNIYVPRNQLTIDLSNIENYSNCVDLSELNEIDSSFSSYDSEDLNLSDYLSTKISDIQSPQNMKQNGDSSFELSECKLMNGHTINGHNTLNFTDEAIDNISISSCQEFDDEDEFNFEAQKIEIVETILKTPLKSSLKTKPDSDKLKNKKRVSFSDLQTSPSISIHEKAKTIVCSMSDDTIFWSDDEN